MRWLLLIAVLILCVAQIPEPESNYFAHRRIKRPHLFDSTNWNASAPGSLATNKSYWGGYSIGSGDGAQTLYNRFDRPIFKARDNDSILALYFGDAGGLNCSNAWHAITFDVQGMDSACANSNSWPRFTWGYGSDQASGMRFSQAHINDVELTAWNNFLSGLGRNRIVFAVKADGRLVFGGTNDFELYRTDITGLFVSIRSNLVAEAALAVTPVSVSLTADNQTVSTTNRSYILLSSDNGTAANRTFVLTPSNHSGAQLTLEWVGTNAGEIEDDSANTGGGTNRLSATWTPTQYDKLLLSFNGTDWTESGRSAN